METIAVHTCSAEGHKPDNVCEHHVIPEDLDAALRRARAQSWRIRRDSRDLVPLVKVEDYAAMRLALAEDLSTRRWQEHANQFLRVADSSSAGYDCGIEHVWSPPATGPGA